MWWQHWQVCSCRCVAVCAVVQGQQILHRIAEPSTFRGSCNAYGWAFAVQVAQALVIKVANIQGQHPGPN